MSPLKSAPFYWAECDVCGESQTHDGDISAWAQEDIAAQDVRDADGLVQRYWLPDGADRTLPAIIVCGRCVGKYHDAFVDAEAAEAELDLLDRDDAEAEARLDAWIAAHKVSA